MRQEAIPGLKQINQSEDSIMQNTTYTSHLLITVLLLEGEPGPAYKVQKQRSYILYPDQQFCTFTAATIFGLKSRTVSQSVHPKQCLHGLYFEISILPLSVQTWYFSVEKKIWLFHVVQARKTKHNGGYDLCLEISHINQFLYPKTNLPWTAICLVRSFFHWQLGWPLKASSTACI